MKPSPQQIWKYNQVIYTEILDELERHFKVLNVFYMPIKGAYLIRSGIAEKMAHRRMDDIDILVKKDDFNKVCDYFSNLPQVKFLKHKWYFEKEFGYSIGTILCYFEVHWLLNYPERFNLPTENLFNRTRSFKGFQILPCPEDALIILLCHTLVHIAYEIRETLFEEISLISAQEDFSWSTFWELAKTTGITSFFWFILLCYKKEKNGSWDIVPEKYNYGYLLAKTLCMKWYTRAPLFWKRLFFEMPFINNPLQLIKHNLLNKRNTCRQ